MDKGTSGDISPVNLNDIMNTPEDNIGDPQRKEKHWKFNLGNGKKGRSEFNDRPEE
jgi:hypothetical protein